MVMKKIIFLTFMIAVVSNPKAQTTYVDSIKHRVDGLKKQLDMTLPDSSRLTVLSRLGDYYMESKPDSCLFYVKKLLALSTRMENTDMMCRAYRLWGMCESITGNYAQALQMALKSLELAESTKDSKRIAFAYNALSYIYGEYGDWHKAITYSRQCKKIAESLKDTTLITRSNGSIGYAYANLNILDSALIHTQQVYASAIKARSRYVGLSLRDLGNIQFKLNNKNLALEYYRMAADSIQARFPNTRVQSSFYFSFANIYYKYGVTDSAIYYAQQALNIARVVPYLRGIQDAGKLLSALYDSLHKTDSAFFYQKLFVATNDSLNSSERTAGVTI
jgi:tetratricopeptide (TPR) repeat protein